MINAKSRACGVAAFLLAAASPLHAQLELGTWVRQPTSSMPGDLTMTIEPCCNGGRRLIYHFVIEGTPTVLTVDSRLDGSDAPVLMGGKVTGETMAIKRLDAHHASTVVRMDGKPFGTSEATLSADGKTLTVINDFSASVGGQVAGKHTEIWVRK